METGQEGSGNWGIAGRELSAADAITADKRLTAIARGLKDADAGGNLDQLRAAVLVALLTGRDPESEYGRKVVKVMDHALWHLIRLEPARGRASLHGHG